jgi:hypothetical protein
MQLLAGKSGDFERLLSWPDDTLPGTNRVSYNAASRVPRMRLSFMTKDDTPALGAISPRHQLCAYEALWLEKGATFKTIAEKFAAETPPAEPSPFSWAPFKRRASVAAAMWTAPRVAYVARHVASATY